MAYVNTKTKKIVTVFDIRIENPNVSFPNGPWSDELLGSLGYAELRYPEHPQPGRFEKLVEKEPEKIDGFWYRKFVIEPLSQEEESLLISNKWLEVRQTRDDLLKNSDWTQLPDSPIKNKQEWADYRKKLRTLFDDTNDPFNIVWPKQPSLD